MIGVIPDPCEHGNHKCHDLATCVFDGQQCLCKCPPYMNGDGLFCSSQCCCFFPHYKWVPQNPLSVVAKNTLRLILIVPN